MVFRLDTVWPSTEPRTRVPPNPEPDEDSALVPLGAETQSGLCGGDRSPVADALVCIVSGAGLGVTLSLNVGNVTFEPERYVYALSYYSYVYSVRVRCARSSL